MDVLVSMIISNHGEYRQCYVCRAIVLKGAKKCHNCKSRRFTLLTKDKKENLADLQNCHGDIKIEVS